MYTVGDTHSHMFPVGVGDGRRGGSLPCTQWGTLTYVPSGGMVEERRSSGMYAVGDAQ